jgi:hypothetical protein
MLVINPDIRNFQVEECPKTLINLAKIKEKSQPVSTKKYCTAL